MSTSTVILFGSNALTMNLVAVPTATDKQAYSVLGDLFNESAEIPYASFESNRWLLNGNYKFLPASGATNTGWVSSSMSDAYGVFASPPELTITLDTEYSTTGITLRFLQVANEYAAAISVAYYDDTNTLIRTDGYSPTSWEFSTNQAVANFKKIIITIISTNKAYRYIRMMGIDLDTITRWTGENIKSARLVEEISPLSTEMPSNELYFTLYSADGDFSIVDPAGSYTTLQEGEPIEAYEIIDGAPLFLGRFYIKDWDSRNENEADFVAHDAIALLEKTVFLCPKTSVSFSEDMVAAIFAAVNLGYTMDAALESAWMWETYDGLLPIMSCRDALRNVLFACGGYATCSRSRVVQLKPFELASSLIGFDHNLGPTEKGLVSPVKIKKIVTGVDVFSFSYARIYYATPQNVYDGSLAIGEHTITFNDAYYAIFNTLISGTATLTITDEGRNWVILDVTGAGTVIIDQPYYFKLRKSKISIVNTPYVATTSNYIVIENAYLVNPFLGDDQIIAQRVYDYSVQRYIQQTKLYKSQIKVGDSVLISTQKNKQIQGIVERAEYDLTGGFVSNVEIVGVVAA